MPHRNQTFDSNGPNVKIRGNAYQVFERYIALAREAASSGDRIAAENLYQHAEHYYRIMNANGEGQGNPMNPRPMTPADNEMSSGDSGEGEQPQAQQPYQPQGQHQHPHHGQQRRQPPQQQQQAEPAPQGPEPASDQSPQSVPPLPPTQQPF
jgi:hypothetical protein